MRTIDFHAHPIPEQFAKGLEELGIDPIEDDGFPSFAGKDHSWQEISFRAK
ncbi:MAG: hypothetical protein HUJ54_06325 [Erysipelotrichaceae bacterium]|nr:hypothetical protein [Erysipelotrichaceae bacterium]